MYKVDWYEEKVYSTNYNALRVGISKKYDAHKCFLPGSLNNSFTCYYADEKKEHHNNTI